MKIQIHAHLDPDTLIERGLEAGLSEEAANYFRHFEEIHLELDVDPENGAVCDARILTKL